jgi:transcriptional regulator with XRE-family HTH domain
MPNHRLRNALAAAEISQAQLAESVDVSVKSVERWITQDRQPHPRARSIVSRLLGYDETYFWPALLGSEGSIGAARSELVQLWPTRNDVPGDVWQSLIRQAMRRLDILVYAGGFLVESFRLGDVLRTKSVEGVETRILIGDPTCEAVRLRGLEEGLPTLAERCRSTLEYLAEAGELPNVSIRTHTTTLYASHFRFDDAVLINTHTYGAWAARSPVQHIQRVPGGQLFDYYDDGFTRVWETAAPVT